MRKQVFQAALQQQFDRIIADQVETPELAADHQRVNTMFAALYSLWARRGPEAEIDEEVEKELRGDGWSDVDIEALRRTAVQNGAKNLISKSKTDALLKRVGIPINSFTVKQAYRIIFDARSKACLEGSRRAGEHMPYGELWARESIPDGGGDFIVCPPSGHQEQGPQPVRTPVPTSLASAAPPDSVPT